MQKLFCAAAIVTAVLATGCSSSSDDKTPPPTGSSGTSESPGSSGTASNSSGTPAETAPTAPKITSVAKMMSSLHVMWTNNETACDSIEGERQAQMADGSIMESYKVVFKLPGDADNKHDASATEDMKYTYRLRCKKGTTYSEYSNEMSNNPAK